MEQVFASKPKAGEPWDVVIIGSGPAALTAAIYTTRGALSTLILGGEKWGGQLMLTTTVDNFPGFPEGIQGPDLMQAMRKQAQRFGAEFLEKNVESTDLTLPADATRQQSSSLGGLQAGKKPFEISAGGQRYLAKSVIIATGASTVWLDVPGLSRLIGRGVSSCAPCDAPFFKDKRVAVVGGGDSAMEEASVLTKYATEVTIIHRRDTFRASEAMQQKVLSDPKIKVLWDTEVVGVKGESQLESLSLKNNKTGENSELSVDGLFIAIGHKPESDIFKDLVEVDERGYIKRGSEGARAATNIPGVFVAGDVHDHTYKQAITAAGFGCMAAIDVIRYLEETKV